jgi:hypothetical protein
MRATFMTLLIDDGGDEDIIERRITHTRRSRSAFDGGAQREAAAVAAGRTLQIRYRPLPSQNVPGKAATSCRRPWSRQPAPVLEPWSQQPAPVPET